MDITASTTVPLKPERLPPTENAARYHMYRTHLQVMQWKSLLNCDINPQEWGWKLIDDHFVPIATDLTAAPDDLLKIIRCKCKTETKHPCSTQSCTCLKHGLPCVAACKHCQGCECENASIAVFASDDTDLCNVMSDDAMEFSLAWLYEEIV